MCALHRNLSVRLPLSYRKALSGARLTAITIGFGFLGSIVLTEGVLAHGVVIDAEVKSLVEVTSRYDDGQPMKQAQIKVFAPESPEVPKYTGTTDAQGRYSFRPTESGAWDVFVRQAGHGGETVLVVDPSEDDTVVVSTTSSEHSWPQRFITIGAVVWGCIGTALYFKGRST